MSYRAVFGVTLPLTPCWYWALYIRTETLVGNYCSFPVHLVWTDPFSFDSPRQMKSHWFQYLILAGPAWLEDGASALPSGLISEALEGTRHSPSFTPSPRPSWFCVFWLCLRFSVRTSALGFNDQWRCISHWETHITELSALYTILRIKNLWAFDFRLLTQSPLFHVDLMKLQYNLVTRWNKHI